MNDFIKPNSTLAELDARARDIFAAIVETYIATGEPVGSRTLSQKGFGVSPATIRNVMADLASLGLLNSLHASSGREPTYAGLRLFVDSILEVSEIAPEDKAAIDDLLLGKDNDLSAALHEASSFLSGVAGGAGLVTTPSRESPISHVEFVLVGDNKAIVILVLADGQIENRLIDAPLGITSSQLQASTNFLNHHLRGKTLSESIKLAENELLVAERELDSITSKLIKIGIAEWSVGNFADEKRLIVRGRGNLLVDPNLSMDIEKARILFDELEKKRDLIQMLDATKTGSSVKLFIGSENPLFALSGSALIAAPYNDAQNRVIGALGVIGPTRINYAKIIPIVDYTAKVLSNMIQRGVNIGW